MVFDLNVYLGRWPFRRLRHAGAEGVRGLMARTGTSRALAIPLQAVFYKDCLDGVCEMVEEIRQEGTDLLPLAMVNPDFPGWERDLRQMVEILGCVGCGVVPNYHGYRVYDPCAEALLRTLGEMGLPALVFVRLWDERSHHWRMQVPPLTVDDLTYVLKTYPELRVAVCNANLPSEGVALAPVLADRVQTLLTTAYKSLKLAEMVERVGAEHLAYGSGMPFYYPESALLQVRDAEIDERARAMILAENARAFLGLEEGHDAG
jgi:predicted TIM-barrel fold metal-dependent hydrolase